MEDPARRPEKQDKGRKSLSEVTLTVGARESPLASSNGSKEHHQKAIRRTIIVKHSSGREDNQTESQ